MASRPTNIKYIPIESLHFDSCNPRLPSSIDGNDDRAVLSYLFKDASLIELMGSIGEQGYFAGEPLLVCPNPSDKDSFLVVEGNRRFASVRLLNDPGLAPSANKSSVQAVVVEAKYIPKELPAVVYETREDILSYLSYRHITGIKAWNPLQKAKYLSQLRDSVLKMPQDQQFRTLAKRIGTRADYVARLLTGYSVFHEVEDNGFYGIRNLDEGTFDFSVLTTALTYANIRHFLGVDNNDDPNVARLKKDELKELIHWMFQPNSENKTRLGESRNLKYLSEVVASEKALNAFRDGMPLTSAKDLTAAPAMLFRLALAQSRTKLVIARDTLHQVEKPTSTDEDTLVEIQAIARGMRAAVRDSILAAEDVGER